MCAGSLLRMFLGSTPWGEGREWPRQRVKDLLVAGGVASSQLLRKLLLERNEKRRTGLNFFFGRPEFSGDNAVGVALIGIQKEIEIHNNPSVGFADSSPDRGA